MQVLSFLLLLLILTLSKTRALVHGPGPGPQMQSRAVDTRITLEIQEGLPKGTKVGSIPTKPGFTYRFNEAPKEFTLNANTGEIKTNSVLDREGLKNDRFDLVVLSSQPTYPIEVRIVVLDVNDNPPEFPESVITVDLAESAAAGTRILLDSAYDRDTGSNGISDNYKIIGGNGEGKFRLALTANPTGETSYLHLETTGKLDRESQGFYLLNISAEDNGSPPKFGYLQVNVTILDVNDNPPIFDHSDYIVSLNETVPPGTPVLRVMATDNDLGDNARISYYLSDSERQFVVDADTGVISTGEVLVCPPQQRQQQQEGNVGAKSCVFTVFARDHGSPRQDGRTYVTVNLLDANDHDPIIKFRYFPPTANHATVDENAGNGSVVAAISVVDQDEGPNGETSVSILTGNHLNHFRLDQTPSFDIVRVNGVLDREEISKYNLTIIASDRGNPARTSSAFLIIEVNDVNDHEPIFEKTEYSAVLSELSPEGSYVASIEATDEDSGVNSEIHYAFISGNQNGWFGINAKTGLVTTIASLDREIQGTLDLNISARDGGPNPKWAYTQLKITILDENDEKPKFTQAKINASLSENSPAGSLIAMLTASDHDQGTNGSVTYSLHPSTQLKHPKCFTLDQLTGKLSTVKKLDREKTASYEILIIAKDQGIPAQSSTATVFLSVRDVNDNPPRFYPRKYFVVIPSGLKAGAVLTQVTASDLDEGENGLVAYELVSGADGVFAVNSTSGVVSLRTDFDNYRRNKRSPFNDHQKKYKKTKQSVYEAHDDVNNSDKNKYKNNKQSAYNGFNNFDQDVDFDDFNEDINFDDYYNDDIVSENRSQNNQHYKQDSRINENRFKQKYGPNQSLENAHQIKNNYQQSSGRKRRNALDASYPLESNYKTLDLANQRLHAAYDEQIQRRITSVAYEQYQYSLSDDYKLNQEVHRNNRAAYEQNRKSDLSSDSLSADLSIDTLSNPVYDLAVHRRNPREVPKKIHRLVISAVDAGNKRAPEDAVVEIILEDHAEELHFEKTAYDFAILEDDGDRAEIGRDVGKVSVRLSARTRSRRNTDAEITSGSLSADSPSGTLSADSFGYNSHTDSLFSDIEGFKETKIQSEDVISEHRLSANSHNHPEQEDNEVRINRQIRSLDIASLNKEKISSFETEATEANLNPEPNVDVDLSSLNQDDIPSTSDTKAIKATEATKVKDTTHTIEATESTKAKSTLNIEHSKTRSRRETRFDFLTASESVSYFITNGDPGGVFEIDERTGRIFTSGKVDREEKSAYALTICARAGFAYAQAIVRINILDLNDNKPEFLNEKTEVSLPENAAVGQAVYICKVRDPDSGIYSKISYGLSFDPEKQFGISEATGVVFLNKPISASPGSVLHLEITASDSGEKRLTSKLSISISVEDVNDHTPVFDHTSYETSLLESTPVNTRFFALSASDSDLGKNARIAYKITEGDREAKFGIFPDGLLYVKTALDREEKDYYSLTIEAVDSGEPKRSSSVPVVIHVIDENDNAPQFTNSTFTFSVSENEPPDTFVGKLTAYDEDIGRNAELVFSLSASQGDFKVDPKNGFVKTLRAFDREELGEALISFEATVSDNGNPRLKDKVKVNVRVTDVNDNAPKFLRTPYKALVSEGSALNTQIVRLHTSDADEGLNGDVFYKIHAGNEDGIFEIDEATGVIILVKQLDRERRDKYKLSVIAYDAAVKNRLSASASVLIEVMDENDNAPQFIRTVENVNRFSAYDKTSFSAYDHRRKAEGKAWDNRSFNAYDHSYDYDSQQNAHKSSPGAHDFIQLLQRVKDSGLIDDFLRLLQLMKNHNASDAELIKRMESKRSDVGVYDSVQKLRNAGVFERSNSAYDVLRTAKNAVGEGFDDFVRKLEGFPLYDRSNAGSFSAYDYDNAKTSALNTGSFGAYDQRNRGSSSAYDFNENSRSHDLIQAIKTSLSSSAYDLLLELKRKGVFDGSADFFDLVQIMRNSSDDSLNAIKTKMPVIETTPVNTELIRFDATDADLGLNSEITYSITSGNRKDTFRIDPTSGILSLHKNLDYEELTGYRLNISASDGGNPKLSTILTFSVDVLDANDNPPSFTNTAIVRQIREGIPVHTPIVTVTAEDPDSGANGKVAYAIAYQEPGDFNRHFGINPTTGVIHTLLPIDREEIDTFRLTVTATDEALPLSNRLSADKLVTVIVEDVNDNAPVFVSMNAAVLPTIRNALIMNVFARDLDSSTNGLVTYELSSGSTDLFYLHRSTGALTLRKVASAASTLPRYKLNIKATDEAVQSERKSTDAYITIISTSDDNPGPVFTSAFYSGSVFENEAAGTSVLSVSARYGASIVEYYVTNVTGDGVQVDRLFDVDAKLGVLSTVVELDREAGLGVYEAEIYAIVVGESAGMPRTSKTKVRITVLDKNDSPPSFSETPLVYSASEDLGVGSVVATIKAKDPDTIGTLKYTLLSSENQTQFTLDGETGVLRLADSLDRETKDVYKLIVRASDGIQHTDTVVTIQVTDTNDNPPVFLESAYSFDVQENAPRGSRIGQVRAEDPDLGLNAQLTYTVISDWANDVFSLNPQTGVFTLTSRLDYEEVQHYILVVQAQDSGSSPLSSTLTVYCNVIDLNDNAPIFDPMSYSNEIFENVSISTSVLSVSATDLDSGDNGRIEYSITSGDENGDFGITKNGTVFTNKSLDRETRAVYNLIVTGTDLARLPEMRLSSTVQATITLKDVNDMSPEFITSNTTSVPENSPLNTIVTAVKAIDRDEGRNGYIEYHLEEDDLNEEDKSVFSLGPVDGLLRVSGRIDRELKSVYTLGVVAKDRGDPVRSARMRIVVSVEDVNDNSPVFDPRRYSASVAENASIGASVLQVSATDIDAGANGRVRYTITDGDPNRDFTISEDTGSVRVAKNLNYERKSRYVLTVRAEDCADDTADNPVRSDTALITVAVSDVNDNPPTFLDSPYLAYVMENVVPPNGGYVVTVKAFDADTPPFNSLVRYFIKEGDTDVFRINASTGEVSLLRALDREEQAEYTLSLVAMDTGSPPLTGTGTVKIIVQDANDNSPQFKRQSYKATIAENFPPGTWILTPEATDRDSGLNSKLKFNLLGEKSDRFEINEETGEIRTNVKLDREETELYQLTLTAQDSAVIEKKITAVNLTIVVEDENDNFPKFSSDAYEIFLPDSIKNGDFVFGARAVDLDQGINSRITYKLIKSGDSKYFSIDEETGVIKARVELEGWRNLGREEEKIKGRMKRSFELLTDDSNLDRRKDSSVYIAGEEEAMKRFNQEEEEKRGIKSYNQEDKGRSNSNQVAAGSHQLGQSYNQEDTGRRNSNQVAEESNKFSHEEQGGKMLKIKKEESSQFDQEEHGWRKLNQERNNYVPKEEQSRQYSNKATKVKKNSYRENSNREDLERKNFDKTIEASKSFNQEVEDEEANRSFDLQEPNTKVNQEDLGRKNFDQVIEGNKSFNEEEERKRFNQEIAEEGRKSQDKEEDGRKGSNNFKQEIERSKNTNRKRRSSNFNQESKGRRIFNLQIEASDGGNPQKTAVASLKIHLQQTQLFPVFDPHQKNRFTLKENLPACTLVTTLKARSPKKGSEATVKYAIAGGNVGEALVVNGASGEVKINVGPGLDFEVARKYEVWFEAKDSDFPSLSSVMKLTISVTDANDNPPVFESALYNASILEEELPPVLITKIRAKDADSGQNSFISYRLVDDFDGTFEIDEESGEINTNAKLDREEIRSYELLVEAVDHGEPQLTGSSTILITVLDKNDNPPRFTRLFSVNVTENAEIGSFVIKVTSSDLDEGENANATYSFTENPGGKFKIDPISGNVTVSGLLDREQQDEYLLKVAAVDGAWRAETPLTITIQDQNDNSPEFEHSFYSFNFPELHEENAYVGRVVASDRDKQGPNSVISYSLQQPSDCFTVDPADGKIFTKKSLKYKYSQLESSPENVYTLTIIATDNGKPPMSSECVVNVNVIDANNNPPRFKQRDWLAPVPLDSHAKQRLVRVEATDELDFGINAEIVYVITGGNGSEFFEIDRNSGWISLKEEATSRIKRDISYWEETTGGSGRFRRDTDSYLASIELEEEARDEPGRYIMDTNSDSGLDHYKIDEQNQHSVEISNVKSNGFKNDNNKNSEWTGIKANAKIDGNSNSRSNRFKTNSNTERSSIAADSGRFKTDRISNSRSKRFKNDDQNLNAERTIADATRFLANRNSNPAWQKLRKLGEVFTLRVKALDKGIPPRSDEAFVKLIITGENKHGPIFTALKYQVIVPENEPLGSTILTVSAADADEGPNGMIRYEISAGNELGKFKIEKNGGGIKIAQTLDYDSVQEYNLNITAYDLGFKSKQATAMLTITLTDINDNPPVFNQSLYEGYLAENKPANTYVCRLQATDLDSPKNAVIRYKIASGSGKEVFNIDPSSGVVRSTTSFDYEEKQDYFLEIVAYNPDSAMKTSTRLLIHITGINEFYPKFTKTLFLFDVSESAEIGTKIGEIRATDQDLGEDGEIFYLFVGASNDRGFAINPLTGAISVSKHLDRETQSRVVLTVLAKNAGGIRGNDTAEAQVVVTIQDGNDPPEFVQKNYEAEISEAVALGSFVLRVKAVDKDVRPQNNQFSYAILRCDYERAYRVQQRFGRNSKISQQIESGMEIIGDNFEDTALVVNSFGSNSQSDNKAGLARSDFGRNSKPDAKVRSTRSDFGRNLKTGESATSITDEHFEEDCAHVFKIDPQSGEIETAKKLDREKIDAYTLVIGAIDTGFPPQTGSTLVKIQVGDVNDNGPIFENSSLIGEVLENSHPGTRIMVLEAKDPDLPPNGAPFTYRITEGEYKDYVNLDKHSGILTTTHKIFDREALQEIRLTVEVEDSGLPKMKSSHVLRIKILDQNDSPSSPRSAHVLVYTFDQEFPIGKIAEVQPNDPDTSGNYTCRIIQANTHNQILSVNSGCDLHASKINLNQGYSLSVLGNDGLHADVTSSITVEFINFDNFTVEESITVRVEDLGAEKFLADYYGGFLELLKTIFSGSGSFVPRENPRGMLNSAERVDTYGKGSEYAQGVYSGSSPSGKSFYGGSEYEQGVYTGSEHTGLSGRGVSSGSLRAHSSGVNENGQGVFRTGSSERGIFSGNPSEKGVYSRNKRASSSEERINPHLHHEKGVLLTGPQRVMLYGINEVSSGLELTLAVKIGSGYKQKSALSEELKRKQTEINSFFRNKEVKIDYDPCLEGKLKRERCENGGVCSEAIEVKKVTSITNSANIIFTSPLITHEYHCVCQEGFAGKNCDLKQNPCAPNPCKSGGFCRRQAHDFVCVCPSNKRGKVCELDKGNPCDEDPCANGGSCKESPDGLAFFCLCRLGYRGNRCESLVDSCRPNPCLHSGLCVPLKPGYKCSCTEGRYGRHCEKSTYSFHDLSYSTFPSLDPTTNDITFIFSTTKPTSLLIYNYGTLTTGGRSDFVAVELLDGRAVLSFGGARSAITRISVGRGKDGSLADGGWYKVTATRNGRVVSLSAAGCTDQGDMCGECRPGDGGCYADGVGQAGTLNFNNNPVLIGGLRSADPVLERPGQVHSDDFVGCVHSVTVNGRQLNLSEPLDASGVDTTCMHKSTCRQSIREKEGGEEKCGRHGFCSDRWHTTVCECKEGVGGENVIAPNCFSALEPMSFTEGGFVEFVVSRKHKRMQLLDGLYKGSSWVGFSTKISSISEGGEGNAVMRVSASSVLEGGKQNVVKRAGSASPGESVVSLTGGGEKRVVKRAVSLFSSRGDDLSSLISEDGSSVVSSLSLNRDKSSSLLSGEKNSVVRRAISSLLPLIVEENESTFSSGVAKIYSSAPPSFVGRHSFNLDVFSSSSSPPTKERSLVKRSSEGGDSNYGHSNFEDLSSSTTFEMEREGRGRMVKRMDSSSLSPDLTSSSKSQSHSEAENIIKKIGFSFRTHDPNGLLLYAASNKHFTTLELINGEIIYTSKLSARVSTSSVGHAEVADGAWHKITLHAQRRVLKLFLDGKKIGDELDTASVHDFLDPYLSYLSLAGVGAQQGLKFKAFEGCLANFTVNDEVQPFNGSGSVFGEVTKRGKIGKGCVWRGGELELGVAASPNPLSIGITLVIVFFIVLLVAILVSFVVFRLRKQSKEKPAEGKQSANNDVVLHSNEQSVVGFHVESGDVIRGISGLSKKFKERDLGDLQRGQPRPDIIEREVLTKRDEPPIPPLEHSANDLNSELPEHYDLENASSIAPSDIDIIYHYKGYREAAGLRKYKPPVGGYHHKHGSAQVQAQAQHRHGFPPRAPPVVASTQTRTHQTTPLARLSPSSEMSAQQPRILTLHDISGKPLQTALLATSSSAGVGKDILHSNSERSSNLSQLSGRSKTAVEATELRTSSLVSTLDAVSQPAHLRHSPGGVAAESSSTTDESGNDSFTCSEIEYDNASLPEDKYKPPSKEENSANNNSNSNNKNNLPPPSYDGFDSSYRGSMSTLVASDDELVMGGVLYRPNGGGASSVTEANTGWDYLLSWGPNFESLAGVFKDIAELPDAVNGRVAASLRLTNVAKASEEYV